MTKSDDGTCGHILAHDVPPPARSSGLDGFTPTYEIRICNSGHHPSLIIAAECRNDIAAIFMARNFIRRGEGAEVWREDTLVYRLEPRVTGKAVRPAKPPRQPVSSLNFQWWVQCLVNAIAIRSPNNWLNP